MGATFVLGNRVALAYTPPLSHIPHSRILARCSRWRPVRFCGIRPVGVIRPLLDLPYFGNRSAEKQKSRHFCNFFAIRDSFLLP